MKTNNYDFIAPWYDRLSRMVFFKAQVNAQKEQLSFIENGQRILIVGGGTGWILEEIAAIKQNLEITYVEISANMLELARERKCGKNSVVFVNQAIEYFVDHEPYDVIVTAFLFDNFGKERAELVFTDLDQKLKNNGLWLFSDFSEHDKENHWQNFLLKLMYFFFENIASIEAKNLINMDSYFKEKEYKVLQKKEYYKSFIKAIVYKKNEEK